MGTFVASETIQFVVSLPAYGQVWTAEDHGWLRIRDPATGDVMQQTQLKHLKSVTAMVGNGDQGSVWCGHADGVISVMNAVSRTAVAEMVLHEGPVLALAASPAFGIVAGASADGRVSLWDDNTLKCVHATAVTDGAVTAVVVDEAASFVVAGCHDGTIRVLDTRGNRIPSLEMAGHSAPITCLALHGELLWSGSKDGSIRVWSYHTGTVTCEATLAGHKSAVRHMAVCAGDSRVWTASDDGFIMVYDGLTLTATQQLPVASGNYRARKDSAVGSVTAVAPISGAVVWRVWTCCSDGTVRTWLNQVGEAGMSPVMQPLSPRRREPTVVADPKLVSENELLKQEVAELRRTLADRAGAVDELARHGDSRDRELHGLRQTIAELESHLSRSSGDAAQEREAADTVASRARADAAAARERLLALEDACGALRAERDELLRRLAHAQTGSDTAQGATQRARDEATRARDEATRCREAQLAAEDAKRLLETELGELRHRLTTLQAGADTERDAWQRSRDEAARLRELTSAAQEAARAHQLEAEEQRRRAANLQATVSTAEEVSERTREELARMQESQTRADDARRQCELQLEETRRRLSSVEADADAQRAAAARRQQQLQDEVTWRTQEMEVNVRHLNDAHALAASLREELAETRKPVIIAPSVSMLESLEYDARCSIEATQLFAIRSVVEAHRELTSACHVQAAAESRHGSESERLRAIISDMEQTVAQLTTVRRELNAAEEHGASLERQVASLTVAHREQAAQHDVAQREMRTLLDDAKSQHAADVNRHLDESRAAEANAMQLEKRIDELNHALGLRTEELAEVQRKAQFDLDEYTLATRNLKDEHQAKLRAARAEAEADLARVREEMSSMLKSSDEDTARLMERVREDAKYAVDRANAEAEAARGDTQAARADADATLGKMRAQAADFQAAAEKLKQEHQSALRRVEAATADEAAALRLQIAEAHEQTADAVASAQRIMRAEQHAEIGKLDLAIDALRKELGAEQARSENLTREHEIEIASVRHRVELRELEFKSEIEQLQRDQASAAAARRAEMERVRNAAARDRDALEAEWQRRLVAEQERAAEEMRSVTLEIERVRDEARHALEEAEEKNAALAAQAAKAREAHEAHAAELRATIAQLRKELAAATEELNDLKTGGRDATERHKAEIESLKDDFERQLKEKSAAIQRLEKRLSAVEAERDKALGRDDARRVEESATIQSLREELRKAEATAIEAEGRARQAESAAARAKVDLAAATERAERAEGKLDTAERRVQDLERQLTALQQTTDRAVRDLEQERNDLARDLAQSRHDAEQLGKDIEALKAQCRALKGQLDDRDKELSDERRERRLLADQNAVLKQQVDGQTEANGRLQASLDQLRRDFSVLQDQNASSEGEWAREKAKLLAELDQLRYENQKHMSRLAVAQKELDELRSGIDDVVSGRAEATAKLTRDVAALTDALRKAKADAQDAAIEAERKRNEELAVLRAKLQAEIDRLEAACRALQDENSNISAEVKLLRVKAQKHGDEKRAWDEERAALQEDAARSRKDLTDVQLQNAQDIQNLTLELQKARDLAKRGEREAQSARDELDEVKGKHDHIVARLKSEVNARNTELDELVRQRDAIEQAARRQMQLVHTEMSQMDAEVSTLQRQVNDGGYYSDRVILQGEITELRASVQALQREVARKREEVAAAQASEQQLEATLSGQLRNIKAELSGVAADRDKLAQQLRAKQHEMSLLEKALAEKDDDCAARVRERTRALEDELTAAQAKLEHAQREQRRATEELQALQRASEQDKHDTRTMLRNERAAAEEAQDELRSQIERLQKELRAKAAELTALQREAEERDTDNVGKWRQDKLSMLADLDDLRGQVNTLQAQLRARAQDLADSKADAASQVQELNERLRRQAAESSKRQQELEERLLLAQRDLKLRAAEIAALQQLQEEAEAAATARLRSDKVRLEDQLVELRSQLSKVQAELTSKQQLLIALQKSNSDAELAAQAVAQAERRDLEVKVTALDEDLRRVSGQLAARNKDSMQLERELELVRAELVRVSSERAALATDNGSLREEAGSLRNSNDSLTRERAEYMDSARRAESTIHELQSRLEDVYGQLKSAQHGASLDQQTLSRELTAAREELHKVKQQNEVMRALVDELRLQNRELSEKERAASDALTKERDLAESLGTELSHARLNLERAEQNVSVLRRELESMQTRYTDMDEARQRLQRQLSEAAEEVARLRTESERRIREAETRLGDAERRAAQLEKELADARANLAALEADARQARAEAADKHRNLMASEEELNRARRRVTFLEESLADAERRAAERPTEVQVFEPPYDINYIERQTVVVKQLLRRANDPDALSRASRATTELLEYISNAKEADDLQRRRVSEQAANSVADSASAIPLSRSTLDSSRSVRRVPPPVSRSAAGSNLSPTRQQSSYRASGNGATPLDASAFGPRAVSFYDPNVSSASRPQGSARFGTPRQL